MSNPRLLLLDEVSLGLAPQAVDAVYQSLTALMASGAATVVLVEQDLRRAMSASSRVICMLEGKLILDGPSTGLSRDDITDAYFGLRRQASAVS